MSFLDKVKGLWRAQSEQCVHGWVASNTATDSLSSGAGSYYMQLMLTEMFLRNSRDKMTGRTPVLQSVVSWPAGEQTVKVCQTVDVTPFAIDDDFDVFLAAGRALTGYLPLNDGSVNIDVALLAAPTSSLLASATAFLNDLADLTMVPQLTAAAPVATKIAQGVDKLLGNDKVDALLAMVTSIPADEPKEGHYIVTDLPADELPLENLRVIDGRLKRLNGDAWEPPSGFNYLVVEVRVPDNERLLGRWRQIPEIVNLSKEGLKKLADADTREAVEDTFHYAATAMANAAYSPDLINDHRPLAVRAIRDEWTSQADFLLSRFNDRQTELSRMLRDRHVTERALPDGLHGLGTDRSYASDAADADYAEAVADSSRLAKDLQSYADRLLMELPAP